MHDIDVRKGKIDGFVCYKQVECSIDGRDALIRRGAAAAGAFLARARARVEWRSATRSIWRR
eukprot:COSAG02_NODE_1382_length_12967_cov_9.151694_12_plen_62_part_00